MSRGACATGAVEALRVPQNPLDVLAQQIVAMCAAEHLAGARARGAGAARGALSRAVARGARRACSTCWRAAIRRRTSPSCARASLGPRGGRARARGPGARQLRGALGRHHPRPRPLRRSARRGRRSAGRRARRGDGVRDARRRDADARRHHLARRRDHARSRDRVAGAGRGRPAARSGAATARGVRSSSAARSAPSCASSASAARRAARPRRRGWLRGAYGLDALRRAQPASTTSRSSARRPARCRPTAPSRSSASATSSATGASASSRPSARACTRRGRWRSRRASRSDAGFEVQTLWSDDGIVLRFADADAPPDLDALVPEPEERRGAASSTQLGHSALFAGAVPRERRARAAAAAPPPRCAHAALRAAPARPEPAGGGARVPELSRSCSRPTAAVCRTSSTCRRSSPCCARSRGARGARRRGRRRAAASPFARSLVFAYTAAYLYQGDTPAAERRAQALALDRAMLRDLLGQTSSSATCSTPGVIEAVEAELQGLAEEGAARATPRALADLLRRLGDLSAARARGALRRRSGARGSPSSRPARRAARVRIAGEPRWIAAEDAALYRDALGVAPPPGCPSLPRAGSGSRSDQLAAALRAHPRALHDARAGARASGCSAARRRAEALAALEAAGEAPRAASSIRRGREREWCDPEVLRRIRRRTLARLRGEVAPVDGATATRASCPPGTASASAGAACASPRRGAGAARRRRALVLPSSSA